jgi:3',5'-nucleoside bisphosphate phosphatase
MRRFVDLHTHSLASDGTLPPREVVRLADAKHLYAVALTDHDTNEGIAEARQEALLLPKLRFVAGIEVSAVWPRGTLHILGYAFDEQNADLRKMLAAMLAARNDRNPRIIRRLQELGVGISLDDVRAIAAGSDKDKSVIGRLHIARALVAAGAVRGIDEAFARYLGPGAPAYVDKERLSPKEAIDAIHLAGGVAAIAHPVQLLCENSRQEQVTLASLRKAGAEAIEAYHTDHDARRTRMYLDIARKLGMGVVGGSDFHGSAKNVARVGLPRVPLAAIPNAFAERLFHL